MTRRIRSTRIGLKLLDDGRCDRALFEFVSVCLGIVDYIEEWKES